MTSGWARIDHAIGPIAVQWQLTDDDLQVAQLELPPASTARSINRTPAPVRAWCQAVAAGQAPLAELQHDDLTAFSWRVLESLATKVPAGSVISYGGLADLIGSPGGARAVAGVMARNRFPLICPCHRVIASRGGLGGFQKSRRDGPQRKRAMLEAEGVTFLSNGAIAPQHILNGAPTT